MRPLRLDVAGFTVFREPTVVDFTDVDFFVLVGPTGAGKSTLLDAICFALYGSVPRWADQRGVASALAPSSAQAKVRLVFEVAGTTYVATRVVSRDGKGKVKTSLAGLQRLPESFTLADLDDETSTDTVLGEVLAGTPKEMDAAVPQVIGLPYEHFVTCVVLPQGEFAQFLHAKPSERGNILVNLLGLHVYRKIAERAGELARDSAARADAAEKLLASLGTVDDQAVDAAATRADALRALRTTIDAEIPALTAANEAAEAVKQRLTELDAAGRTLAGVQVPAEVADVSARITAAVAAATGAEQELAAAETAEDGARTAAEATAEPGELRQLLAAHDRLVELTAGREQHAKAVTDAERRLAEAQQQRQVAADRLQVAELGLTEAQRAELVGALRPQLSVGAHCPVCAQEVHALPDPVDATTLRAAEKTLAEARTASTAADQAVREAERDLTTATARLTDHDERLAETRAALADHDDRAAVAAQLAGAERARTAWRDAGNRVRAARQAYQDARTEQERARASAGAAWTQLASTRDALSEHGPPALDREDLATAWSQLVTWTGETAQRLRDRRPTVVEEVTAAEAAAAAVQQRLRELLDDHGVQAPQPLDAAALSAAVAVAVTQAENEHQRLTQQLDQIATQRADRDKHAAQTRVAKALADHLRANNFERWLLQEALDSLVDGASRILAELSGGQYELGHHDGEFYVLDHHDADLRRGVRTLSGGETFQASLALALALSDQLAGMSTTSTALESIVLDEGFGTLDEATLETVAATLENLAVQGNRMVGVVTHVPALAERIPVRFQVTKDARTAYVQRAS
ncbi:MAG: AAA family ATPase [Streptosporangiales bacterium]|nr:AAA family ATPase [Streptosporangiales bacterium]